MSIVKMYGHICAVWNILINNWLIKVNLKSLKNESGVESSSYLFIVYSYRKIDKNRKLVYLKRKKK